MNGMQPTNPHFIFIGEQFLAKQFHSNLDSTPRSTTKSSLSFFHVKNKPGAQV